MRHTIVRNACQALRRRPLMLTAPPGARITEVRSRRIPIAAAPISSESISGLSRGGEPGVRPGLWPSRVPDAHVLDPSDELVAPESHGDTHGGAMRRRFTRGALA